MQNTKLIGPLTKAQAARINNPKGNKKKNKPAVMAVVSTKKARKPTYLGFGALQGTGGNLGVGRTSSSVRSKRDMVIEESEYIAEVTVANEPNFNVVSYAINPGNSTTFPWLSTIAKQFEKYSFEKLSFVYKKEVSEFATNGQTGKVIMSVDYDASDPAPATKQQMEDTVPHADAMPCESFALQCDLRDLRPTATDAKYVRSGGLPGNSDIKTYDVGNLMVATVGQTSNAAVGELHVVYRVRLIKPVLENLAGAPTNYSISAYSTSANTALTTTTPISLDFVTVQSNGLGIVDAAGQYTPPPGNYTATFTAQFAFTGNATIVTAYLQKNGATIGTTSHPAFTFTSGTFTTLPITQSAYISANGTDYINVVVEAVFSTGTCTCNGFLLIHQA
jgi:hypothetical protein